ncbi:c-type cytochrome [Acidisphaera rubrifaciens]|uniref:Cytochrome c n=1 Tax=Acidisphaera rubrifaciens HS-AP3 TaxID=1231350 RepID=A0A0D6P4Y9_9PROT|nr:cytochrome c family protein [Acidisphaera rubrifaciens]GAN76258.1 cytochrome c [Acidisphaera rubrifaciens HS-AP3]
MKRIINRWSFVVVLAAASFTVPCAWAQDAAAGKAVFQSQCSICHSVQKGRNMTGPSLYGVVGRKAGTESGFYYSAGNRNPALVWDAATLERYLANPRSVVPDTTMGYPGLPDAKKRADLIAYLGTLH